ncbi:MAG: cyclic nucleotide-binding domain-containing protein [Mesorhizobium sp.]|uniref:TIR domain-containing protein n=1 Tax=Mesorhizobium sp. TaxID=1871066 RepID=UPI000FE5CF22|nr:TIR domain-containing protein [Mesorhizobium sp.]RWM12855.1 MAG: cyclic nucleotide-binding domain-containing protein [Mesorhizobium sp.]
MKDRFSGERGTALLVEALQNQRLFTGVPQAAQAISALGELVEVSKDGVLIEQNATDNDVYFTISGSFGVFVNSKRVATRYPGDTVGEMAAVSVTQRRSADVVADEDCLVFKVPEAGFCQVADKTPVVWRRLAQELSKRLIQRNALIRPPHEKIRVFVISSAEALHVARAVENAFAHDPFLTVVWANGVFKVTNYTLETLEDELEQSDFAVAIAHPDDQTIIRGENWPSPRDNVVFELGFFMGKLGRDRAILMEPRGQKVKLPSDLAGITTIGYRHEPGGNLASLMSPACNELRDHILRLGRNI